MIITTDDGHERGQCSGNYCQQWYDTREDVDAGGGRCGDCVRMRRGELTFAGHPAEYRGGLWRYVDTGKPVGREPRTMSVCVHPDFHDYTTREGVARANLAERSER